MQKKNPIIRQLYAHYYVHIALLALFFILVFVGAFPFFQEGLRVSVTLERYAIMLTIIAIPAALKLFAHLIKKLPRPAEKTVAEKTYKKAFYLRLYIVSLVTLGNILLFGWSRNTNFMWLTVVLFVVFVFCKPSGAELAGLSEKPEPETPQEEETEKMPENG